MAKSKRKPRGILVCGCSYLGLVAALITIAVGAHAQEFRATISGTVTWVKRCRSSVQR